LTKCRDPLEELNLAAGNDPPPNFRYIEETLKPRKPKHRKRNTHSRAGTLIVVTGMNNVRECLASAHVKTHKVFARQGFDLNSIGRIPNSIKVEWLRESDPDFQELHQGIGCAVSPPHWGGLDTFLDGLLEQKKAPLLLILDQVEDPNNLGQIIRTCEGAGVDAILHPHRRSVGLTNSAAQTSQGAFAHLPMFAIGNLRQTLEDLKSKGFWTFACENQERSIPWHAADLKGPVAVVLGSEGRGIRDLVLKTCDTVISLPMAGHINSLNVSATAAALLFEAVRQRQTPLP